VPTTLVEKLIAHRKILGLSQSAMARKIGIDPATLGRLERENSAFLLTADPQVYDSIDGVKSRIPAKSHSVSNLIGTLR
jgi:DNA-binding XRE family transcriptional regulator